MGRGKLIIAVVWLIALASMLSRGYVPVAAAPPPIASSFSLYTRVTPATWPQLQRYARPGDLFWGKVTGIPAQMRAYEFPNYAALTSQMNDSSLGQYAAINLDGEYSDAATAFSDAGQIRQYVDAYNQRHLSDPGFLPLKFVAFYHLEIINAYPRIVSYPDVVIVGKSFWSASNLQQNADQYVTLISQARRTPGILLGNPTVLTDVGSPLSGLPTVASFDGVISPPPQGLGLNVVGFFYAGDDASSLVAALQVLRPTYSVFLPSIANAPPPGPASSAVSPARAIATTRMARPFLGRSVTIG